jgi:hypothetical protein
VPIAKETMRREDQDHRPETVPEAEGQAVDLTESIKLLLLRKSASGDELTGLQSAAHSAASSGSASADRDIAFELQGLMSPAPQTSAARPGEHLTTPSKLTARPV